MAQSALCCSPETLLPITILFQLKWMYRALCNCLVVFVYQSTQCSWFAIKYLLPTMLFMLLLVILGEIINFSENLTIHIQLKQTSKEPDFKAMCRCLRAVSVLSAPSCISDTWPSVNYSLPCIPSCYASASLCSLYISCVFRWAGPCTRVCLLHGGKHRGSRTEGRTPGRRVQINTDIRQRI